MSANEEAQTTGSSLGSWLSEVLRQPRLLGPGENPPTPPTASSLLAYTEDVRRERLIIAGIFGVTAALILVFGFWAIHFVTMNYGGNWGGLIVAGAMGLVAGKAICGILDLQHEDDFKPLQSLSVATQEDLHHIAACGGHAARTYLNEVLGQDRLPCVAEIRLLRHMGKAGLFEFKKSLNGEGE